MNDDKYKLYLVSLGEIIKKYALDAKENKNGKKGTTQEDFATGYLASFHRIVTLMQQHAETYDIPLKELSLDDIGELDLI